MSRKSDSIKRIFAVLLSVLMIVTYMPVSMFAYAEDTGSEAAVTERPIGDPATDTAVEEPSDGTADADVTVVDGTETADPGQEPETDPDTAVTAGEPEPGEGEDPDPNPEVLAVEGLDAEDAGDAETEEPTDDEPADEAGNVQAFHGKDRLGGDDEEPVEEPEEIVYPAQTFNGEAGGVTVAVNAPEGALPEGTQIVVKPVESSEIFDSIAEAVDGEIYKIIAADAQASAAFAYVRSHGILIKLPSSTR